MQVNLDPTSTADYERFIRIKQLPSWSIRGRTATFPDEYAEQIGIGRGSVRTVKWKPAEFLFDYQRDIATAAIQKRKYAVFADCGLGKTNIILEFAQAAMQAMAGGVLIVSPLMVIEQTIEECHRFYPTVEIKQVHAAELQAYLNTARNNQTIAITNYEAIRSELRCPRPLGALILDESSMLKSHYGKWGTRLIELGRGVEWKLCCTGTPAPNDRIEYANHAVFLGAAPTVNAFLATYFVNRGQTQERWSLKKHAVPAFYRSLSHWCIFLTKPSVYGWTDKTDEIPPIKVHIHDVALTEQQRSIVMEETQSMFVTEMGGIGQRSVLGQISKGQYRGAPISTNKPAYIRALVGTWPSESTIIWCIYNPEQNRIAAQFPEAANISGSTGHDERMRLLERFKAGEIKVMITKPKILGFGLNLQIATRQVFSGLQDSYESFYQAVKRSNRIGSRYPLNVHIPVTEAEQVMVANVLRKAERVTQDAEEQERIFKQYRYAIG